MFLLVLSCNGLFDLLCFVLLFSGDTTLHVSRVGGREAIRSYCRFMVITCPYVICERSFDYA